VVLLGASTVAQQGVILRHRIHLQSRHLAPGTVKLRLGAVRRLAYGVPGCGLLSPDLAAGRRRVKSGNKIGLRLGPSETSMARLVTPEPFLCLLGLKRDWTLGPKLRQSKQERSFGG
jgi:hypothetical protein